MEVTVKNRITCDDISRAEFRLRYINSDLILKIKCENFEWYHPDKPTEKLKGIKLLLSDEDVFD